MVQKRNAFMDTLVGGKNQSVATPPDVYRLLCAMFNVPSKQSFHDPCPLHGDRAPVRDGLKMPWRRLNYVNPPFKDACAWLQKAYLEASKAARCTVVLMPARTHAMYVHEHAFARADMVIILADPVRFTSYAKDFSYPVMLVIFGLRDYLKIRRMPALQWPAYLHVMPKPACGVFIQHLEVPRLLEWVRSQYDGRGRGFDLEMHGITCAQELRRRALATLATAQQAEPCRLFLLIRKDNEACAREIISLHRAWPGAMFVTLWMCRYHAKWFRDIAPFISEVILLSRCIKFDETHKGSMLGSFLATIGGGTMAASAPRAAPPDVKVTQVASDNTVYFISKGSSYSQSNID